MHRLLRRRRQFARDLLADVLAGIVCVQYGLAGAEGYRASIIHAFGHGFDVHQGTIHGVVAPHVLRCVFDRVEGRRDPLASALGVADAGADPADAVTDAVAGVRDDLGLPRRLRGAAAVVAVGSARRRRRDPGRRPAGGRTRGGRPEHRGDRDGARPRVVTTPLVVPVRSHSRCRRRHPPRPARRPAATPAGRRPGTPPIPRPRRR
uniref:iron-containing alcohol dehydrogenase n=1 Tax=Halobellus ruber TaxID=2761102 RepID=UPI0037444045